MSTPKHAKLSPSSAKRWMNCAGSINAINSLPPGERDKPSIYSSEGTLAHSIAYDYGTGKIDALELAALLGEVREQDGFQIPITEEMIDGALEFAEVVAADKAAMVNVRKQAPIIDQQEVRVHAKSIDDEVWGTTDRLVYRKGDRIIVYDYKFGKGMAVDAAENEQMVVYLKGAMETFAGEAFNEMEVVIVQPRAPHADGRVRRWVVSKEWLAQFVAKAKAAAIATRDPEAPLTAGDWCRSTFCPVKRCPARSALAAEKAMVAFDTLPNPALEKVEAQLPNVRMMTDKQLVDAFRWEGFLEAFSKSVRAVLEERASQGTLPVGVKLVEGRSNRKWVDEEAVVARYYPLIGEAVYDKSVLSPAQMEKAARLKKGAVDDLTFKPPGKKSIALDNDPRPTAKSSAQDAFTQLGDAKCPGCDDCAVLGTCSNSAPATTEAVWPQ